MGDLVIFYVALLVTLLVRYGGKYEESVSLHILPFTIIFVIWILVFYITNLYELSVVKNTYQFFSSYFSIMAVNIAIAISFFYLIPFLSIAPKRNLFLFIAIALILEVGWRTLYNRLLMKSGYRNNTLIVGLSQQAQELYDFLLLNPQLGYNALGIIDIKDASAQDLLEKIITQKNVKTLVLGRDVYGIPHIIDMLYRLVGRRMRFYDISKFSERITGKIPLSGIDQAWFLSNLSEGERRLYEVEKRAFDVAAALLLSILSVPFYPLVMLAIYLDTKGPMFIRQVRMGRSGKPFTLYKFRNMISNSPDGSAEAGTGPVWAAEEDPRITRVGRFIRRTRIDELPQVWNVLQGDMSFVGPRPERPEFYEKLRREVPFYEERNLVSPGITGWAQIKYKLDFRGGMTVQDTLEKVQYDLFYIKNRSILLDVGILLKTINILITKIF